MWARATPQTAHEPACRRWISSNVKCCPVELLITSCLLAGVACAPAATEQPVAAQAQRVAPSARGPVVIISIDTLRADRLPAYGYAPTATPAIDDLVDEAVLFETTFSHAPTTTPAHTSLFTAMTPAQHGVRDNLGYGGPSIAAVEQTAHLLQITGLLERRPRRLSGRTVARNPTQMPRANRRPREPA